jgi:hypothetical protein
MFWAAAHDDTEANANQRSHTNARTDADLHSDRDE